MDEDLKIKDLQKYWFKWKLKTIYLFKIANTENILFLKIMQKHEEIDKNMHSYRS